MESTNPEPDDGHRDVHAAVGRVDASGGGGVQRQQPDEERETRRGRDQKPGRRTLLEPEVGQIATDDLGDGGRDEQQGGLELRHWLIRFLLATGGRPDLHATLGA
jgi:hypothetical protein